MNAPYIQKQLAKEGKKSHKVYMPHDCDIVVTS